MSDFWDLQVEMILFINFNRSSEEERIRKFHTTVLQWSGDDERARLTIFLLWIEFRLVAILKYTTKKNSEDVTFFKIY